MAIPDRIIGKAPSGGPPAGFLVSGRKDMPTETVLTKEEIELLRRLNTCQVADAIETFDVRLRNEGFMTADIRCILPHLPPMIGHAVTASIRTSEPPMI